VPGHGARYEQKVSVTGAGDEADTETFEVIDRIVECMDLELAAIAGPRIDVANAERAAE
jgi:hypothetical protein